MENILIQITPNQHESEERFIIGYLDHDEEFKTVIINVTSLSSEEQTTYNQFKALAASKIPVS